MSLAGVFHFSFTVRDLDEAKDFYGRVLGLELVHEMSHTHPYTSTQVGFPDAHLRVAAYRIRGVEPQASTHVLELIEYVNPRGVPIDTATNNPGTAHMAFVVDDIFAEYERLRHEGARFKSEPVRIEAGVNEGGYTVYFLDPGGITLELVQRPLPPAAA